MSARLPHLTSRLQGFGTTIFAEMTALALAHDAVNLGQGFPDFSGPDSVLEAAREAIAAGHNQYAPGIGLPSLRQAIAEHQRRFWGLDYDPDSEITVSAGATEAICAALQALCETGDEVVLFEPYYDSYRASVAMAGAVERVVTLRSSPDGFAFDPADLDAAITAKTRAILLNSPHNPTGKVFTREELELIGRLAAEHDAWVVTDEVYEHLVFDGHQHVPMATLPGMAERTLTISSGGKTFSVTGWKVGWITGPAEAVSAVAAVKQFLTFVGSGPFQPAVAAGLRLGDDFYEGLAASMQSKRDVLVEALTGVGLPVAPCAGTYFVIADAAPLGVTDAVEFCRRLPEEVGVVGVPISAFCDDKDAVATLVRFAFCKREDVLREGARRLARLTR